MAVSFIERNKSAKSVSQGSAQCLTRTLSRTARTQEARRQAKPRPSAPESFVRQLQKHAKSGGEGIRSTSAAKICRILVGHGVCRMERSYHIFEIIDSDPIWRECVNGHTEALARAMEFARKSKNEIRVMHLPDNAVVAVLNDKHVHRSESIFRI
jgi:hypothetical protein